MLHCKLFAAQLYLHWLCSSLVILACTVGTGTETTENAIDTCTGDNAMEFGNNTMESADNTTVSADNTMVSADNATVSVNNTTEFADNAVDTLLIEPSSVALTTVLWSLVGLLTLVSAVSLCMCTILSICLCVCFTHRKQDNTGHGKFAWKQLLCRLCISRYMNICMHVRLCNIYVWCTVWADSGSWLWQIQNDE